MHPGHLNRCKISFFSCISKIAPRYFVSYSLGKSVYIADVDVLSISIKIRNDSILLSSPYVIFVAAQTIIYFSLCNICLLITFQCAAVFEHVIKVHFYHSFK